MKNIMAAGSLALTSLFFTSSAMALELNITPSGYVDFIWTLNDGTDAGKYGEDGQFDTSGELDVEADLNEGVSLRFDADVNPSNANTDSARLEQIFLKWDIDQEMSLKGGVFNNKLTFESEDAPELYQVTHGQLWDIWNSSTAEDGNNLHGVELNYQLDSINLIVGYLNDLGDIADENSLEVGAEIRATDKLDITLGLITQDQYLETIIDVFASYKTEKLLLAGEILLADEGVDNGIMLMTNFQINDRLSATVRYDQVNYESIYLANDTSSLTIAGIYNISKNLNGKAEIRMNDDDNQTPTPGSAPLIGEGDGSTARLELIATF